MDLTVLLMDGDCSHAERMLHFFQQVRPSWKVVSAHLLASGRQLHAQYQPDVAIIAHQLCDGIAPEALAWLGDTMSMVVVGPGQEFVAAACMRAGFADFVVRPREGQSNDHLLTLPEQTESLARQKQTERALRVQSRQMFATLSSLSQGVISWDESGRIQVFNDRACTLLGLPQALLARKPLMREVVDFQRAQGEFNQRHMCWPPGAQLNLELTEKCPDVYVRRTVAGRYIEVRSHALGEGRMVRTYTDVTDYVRIQERLSASEQRWRSMTELSSDWFWEIDAQLQFVHLEGCSPQLREELLGHPFFAEQLWHISATSSTEHEMQQQVLEARETFHDWELLHIGSDGQALWLALSGSPVWDAQGAFTGYRGVARNITERKHAESAVQRLAYRDDLTDLPNRSSMLEQIQHALERSLEQGAGALLLLDIDRFKDVNDALGQESGDALLCALAARLQSWAGPEVTVGRVGGDEFMLILEGLAPDVAQAQARASAMASNLLGHLQQEFELDGRSVHPSFGIGIAGFCGLDQSVDVMRQSVELALGEAKAQGRNVWSVFDPQLRQALKERQTLESDLQQALERREFILHYQPVVDTRGRILGAEALVRWEHPERGRIPPAVFIPVVEQMGLIFALDRCVLRLACEQLVVWARHPATSHWTVAVNLSAQEFRQPDFVSSVQTILAETGAAPCQLKLELTESLMLEDVEACIAKMQTLREMGVRFSLDDFGTGYSSLSYLKRLPLSQLKIDQSFVRDVQHDANDAAIVQTVIALAQSLGLEVVAEGVETQAQWELLKTKGCQQFQGYWFSKPDTAQALEARAQAQSLAWAC